LPATKAAGRWYRPETLAAIRAEHAEDGEVTRAGIRTLLARAAEWAR
jgi:hypothetical protein